MIGLACYHAPAMTDSELARRLKAVFRVDPVVGILLTNVAYFAISMAVAIHLANTYGISSTSQFSPGVDALILSGGNHPWNVVEGQVFRLVTSCFLHGNVLHIAMNMFALMQLGRLTFGAFHLNRPSGPTPTRAFLTFYVWAGIAGSIASIGWKLFRQQIGPESLDAWHYVAVGPSIGASGALFGLMGFLIGFTRKAEDQASVMVRRNMLFWLFIMIVIGFSQRFLIDNAAHFGGAVFGFIVGVAFDRLHRPGLLGGLRRLILHRVTFLVTMAIVVASFAAAVVNYMSWGREYRSLLEMRDEYGLVTSWRQDIDTGQVVKRSRRRSDMKKHRRELDRRKDDTSETVSAMVDELVRQLDDRTRVRSPIVVTRFNDLGDRLMRAMGPMSRLGTTKRDDR